MSSIVKQPEGVNGEAIGADVFEENRTVHPALDISDVSETLLCAVARLKGITDEAISSAINVPKGTISGYFGGRNVGIREEMRDALAGFLGIDMTVGRLTADRVHVFALDRVPTFSSRSQFQLYMQSLGFLLRGSKAASLHFTSMAITARLASRLRGVHAVQNSHSRAIFLGGYCAGFRAKFNADDIEGCTWAGGSRSKSRVKVMDATLAKRIANGDMTVIEFDEIFRGAEATSWLDVEMSARVNLVTKDEIVEWIETIGARRAMEQQLAAVAQETAAERWLSKASEPTVMARLARVANGA